LLIVLFVGCCWLFTVGYLDLVHIRSFVVLIGPFPVVLVVVVICWFLAADRCTERLLLPLPPAIVPVGDSAVPFVATGHCLRLH
jgi:hypothetical protein